MDMERKELLRAVKEVEVLMESVSGPLREMTGTEGADAFPETLAVLRMLTTKLDTPHSLLSKPDVSDLEVFQPRVDRFSERRHTEEETEDQPHDTFRYGYGMAPITQTIAVKDFRATRSNPGAK